MDQRERMVNLTYDMAYFVLFKLKAWNKPNDIDESVLNRSLVENVRKIVWVEKHIVTEDISHFILQHTERMNSRIDLHITYLLYLCFLVKKCFTNTYEVFIRAMTILFTMVTYEDPDNYFDMVGMSATIFDQFCGDIIFAFKRQGGFEKFNRYLKHRETLRLYSKLEELEEAGETQANILKLLKLRPTVLKMHLDEDIKKEDIENYGPSLVALKVILGSGTGAIQNMLDNNVMYHKDVPKSEEEKNSEAVGASEKPIGIEPPVKEVRDTLKTAKSAYYEARKQITNFQEKCRNLEQLLDFVFQETSSNDVKREQ